MAVRQLVSVGLVQPIRLQVLTWVQVQVVITALDKWEHPLLIRLQVLMWVQPTAEQPTQALHRRIRPRALTLDRLVSREQAQVLAAPTARQPALRRGRVVFLGSSTAHSQHHRPLASTEQWEPDPPTLPWHLKAPAVEGLRRGHTAPWGRQVVREQQGLIAQSRERRVVARIQLLPKTRIAQWTGSDALIGPRLSGVTGWQEILAKKRFHSRSMRINSRM